MLAQTAALRSKSLSLYRACLRCARRIRNADQRDIWSHYSRLKFQENLRIRDPKQIQECVSWGQEELDRMTYYLDVKQSVSSTATLPQRARTPNHVSQPAGSSATPAVQMPPATPKEVHSNSTADSPMMQWLLDTLPHLPNNTLKVYSGLLEGAGYDHPSLLFHLQLEDIPSIPKGHARAIIHAANAQAAKR